MRARRRRRRTGPTLLIFVLGLGIFLFPILYGAMTDQEMSDNAQSFLDKWGIYETASTEPLPELPEETIPAETTPYAQLLEEMESYNQNLWDTKQTGLKSPSDYELPSFYLREYGIDNEIFGVISIPKLELTMPIYLGATEQHMVDGAVHLSQTSLPIGGINSNCVLAGHRGYTKQKLKNMLRSSPKP